MGEIGSIERSRSIALLSFPSLSRLQGDMLNAAFELCERVFHRGFEQLERLVCDDFATHSAPLVRQQKMVFSRGTHSPRGLCANAGFCSV